MVSPLFSEIYAVGDSMSDSGGIYGLSSEAIELAEKALNVTSLPGLEPIPISPPYAERFSNGPVLPEITADLLGADLVNFSFGGAEALGHQTLLQAAPPEISAAIQTVLSALSPEQAAPILDVLNHDINLSGQLADFVAETTAHPPSSNSALVSEIGLNDLQALAADFNPFNPLPLFETVAGVINANLLLAHTAFDQGIGTVIFETLPAPSFFPIGDQLSSDFRAIGDAAADAINLGLQADAVALRLEGHDARVVDIARMADEISADPSTFGFQDFHQPALLEADGLHIVPNPDAPPSEQTAFMDPLHPTTNLHGVLAEFAAASLTSQTDFRGSGNDFIVHGSEDDLVLAGAGNDRASLGGGNDILLAGRGNDVATGGQGSDLMSGGSGDDTLAGDNGSDVVAGNAGNDLMNGGNGDDALIDGLGSDTANGGNGDDWFFAIQPQLLGGGTTDVDRFNGDAGNDTLVVRLDPNFLAAEQANVQQNFHAGQSFTFTSMNLTVTGIEHIVLTTDPVLTEVNVTGDLAARLHEADLFGFV